MSVFISRLKSVSPGQRNLLAMAASCALLISFSGQFAQLDLARLRDDITGFASTTWIMAIALTAISFAAISRYDLLAAGFLGLNLPSRVSMATGWRATALSQIIGCGLVTGSFARWRILSRTGTVTLAQSAAMTALICSLFLAGWAVATSLALLAAPELLPGARTLAAGGCLTVLCALAIFAMPPTFLSQRLPSLRFSLDVIMLTLVDTLAAALVIYVFLPEGYVPFSTLYAAFLVAFAAGMFSSLPGGVGAFELCIVTLIAPAEPAILIAALMAYRLVYYILPALLAAPALLRPVEWRAPKPQILTSGKLPASLSAVAPSEITLISHGLVDVETDPTGTMAVMAAHTSNCHIILGDAFGTKGTVPLAQSLRAQAQARRKSICFYRCSAAYAAQMRGLGYRALRIGQEAIIDPNEFSLEHRKFRQLRRKLRAVEKAGVTVEQNHFGWDVLAALDGAWQDRNGAAKGFSMGVFDPAMMGHQLILTARLAGDPVAFVSFHTHGRRWKLDLIRSLAHCPDGTIHALISEAISLAKLQGIDAVSLDNAPFSGLERMTGPLARPLNSLYARHRGLRGLYQFKQSFAPRWEPRYLVANSWTGMALAASDIHGLIHSDHSPPEEHWLEAHNHYVDYEFASTR